MKAYYVRFNWKTKKVDVFRRADDSLIQSVEVINGIVNTIDVEQIASALPTTIKLSDLEYDIYYADRYGREYEEELLEGIC